MRQSIKIIIENTSTTCEVPSGSTLLEIAKVLGIKERTPILAGYVNNRIRELNYRVYSPSTIRYVDYTSFAGVRTYQRTAFLTLQRVIEELYPQNKLYVRRYIYTNEHILLQAENHTYADEILHECRMIGRVVGLVRKF